MGKSGTDTQKPTKIEDVPKVGVFGLFRFTTGYDHFLLAVGTISAAIAGAALPSMSLLFAGLTKLFREYQTELITEDQFQAEINEYTLFFVYLAIGVFTTNYLFLSSFNWVGSRITHKIRNNYLQGLLRQEIAFFDYLGAGEVTTRIISDVNRVQEGISEKFVLIIHDFCTFLCGFIIAFCTDWRLSLMLLTLVPFVVFVVTGMMIVGLKFSTKSLDKYSSAGTIAEECISTIRTITSFNLQNRMSKRYQTGLVEGEKWSIKSTRIFALGVGAIFFILYCGYALAFFYGARLVAWELSTPENIIQVFFAIMMGSYALSSIGPYVQSVMKAQGAAAKLYQCIDRKSKIDPIADTGLKPAVVRGEIEFRNIKFTYPSRPEVQIYENLSLTAKHGETVALVGASGSGKSTVVQLLERFYDPDGGEVLLDGVPIKDLNLRWFRRQIGLVAQEPILFNGTIGQNIKRGLVGTPLENQSEEKQQEAIVEACKMANAHDFISSLPAKYDTNVGERGFLLSGGQKQRIAIARAIVRNPPILLLDEATSALDTQSEVLVQEALDRASEGRTTIVIAHRLSTIRNAHKIVVMERGRILEQGSHDELIANPNGPYSKLVSLQELKKTSEPEYTDESDEDTYHSENDIVGKPISRSPTSQNAFDPAYSQKSIHPQDEDEEYKPYSLVMFFTKIISAYRPYALQFCLGVIGAIILGLSFPAYAVIFAKMLKVFEIRDSQEMIDGADFWALMFVVLAVIIWTTNFLQLHFLDYCDAKLTTKLRTSAFESVLKQETGWFDRSSNSTGNITSKLSTDPQDISGLGGAVLGSIIQSSFNLFGSLIVSFIFGWKLAIVATVCVPILLFSGYFEDKSLQGFQKHNAKAYSKSSEIACEATGAVRTVAALTQEDVICDYYDQIMLGPLNYGFKKAYYSTLYFAISRGIEFLIFGLVFWYGGKLVINEGYTFETVVTIFTALAYGASSASGLLAFIPNIVKARKGATSLFGLIDRLPLIDSTPESQGKKLPTGDNDRPVSGKIEVERVQFYYPTRPGIKVLRGVNFTVQPGQFIALVGPSGCGKSTIISLIERFYDVTKGTIKIDGMDIRDYHLPSLRSHVALVGQEPSLYDMTIGENIASGVRSGHAKPTQEQIEKAAQQANLHDFVMSLPNGYNTSVGSKGTQLSGGQKQRVAIARALIRNPSILLLDEATSALDAESEKVVQQALDNAREGRTTLSIAHRLSTIQKADVILVFDKGYIVERGTHKELLEKKGTYYNMVNQQNLNENH
ncbi:multidrug resistance protein 1 [Conidiobolus coronatus NRRL 28638]|uniref:Multidrug resistance protein 1 n=1 Tax=Conidiobolus coronatus (strain ATCC 28846 / CBS 209.66 / NRRL 28638) TaxID=796925 RepID=A0A137P508_CONC2|nr:multidrug resistance protein 1 [Conidiobolus coronatus NRRL 28638]|eukprot:KXN70088.1 multidrug resistance protein 1 [Conidiobolus coronatus NRRL 28638]